jgi:tryptophanyl-tRNA synthetase
MYRSCRVGHNALKWQQLVNIGPSSTATTSLGQLRSFTPGTSKQTDAGKPNPLIRKIEGKSKPQFDPILGSRREYHQTKESEIAKESSSKQRVIFSAIQPTGVPHLGNYLGALREWKRLQDTARPDYSLIFSVVDLHAITTPRSRDELQRDRKQMLAALLAIGLDPDRCTIFAQSAVPAISELQWILSCTASTGYLSRMTQWKASE